MEQRTCLLCGATEGLEEQHVAGRANDPDLTVTLCRSCHRKVTSDQHDFGADLGHGERQALSRVEAALRSIAAFLLSLAERLLALADAVARHLSVCPLTATAG